MANNDAEMQVVEAIPSAPHLNVCDLFPYARRMFFSRLTIVELSRVAVSLILHEI
jgi:hypothetical protein